MRKEARVPFAALASVPFVLVLSNSMIIPVLPAMQRALGRSLLQVGLLITVFSVAAGLIIPIGGYLSDRYGRKPVMIPGLILFGLGGLLCALGPLLWRSSSYGILLAGRVVQGVGAGGTYQVAMALAGDLFQAKERSKALGLLEASNGFGKVASPILGAAVMTLFWFAPFFLYPIIAGTSAVLVWRLVEEPEREGTNKPVGRFLAALGQVFSKKGAALLACFLAGALALFFLFGVLSFYADVLEQRYGIEGVLRGLVIAIPVAVMALTAYLSGTFLARRLAKLAKATVAIGLGLIAAAFVIMFFVSRLIVPFTAAIALMGFGNGLVLPALNTMITSATQSTARGTVTALYGTVRFFGAALGPPAFDKAVRTGTMLPYLGSAALAVVALIVALIWIRQRQLLGGFGGGQDSEHPKARRRGPVQVEHARPGQHGPTALR